MTGFDGVVGHEEIISHLQNAIRLGKVSHAYIFGGEHGSGKKLLASLFAMTLQCQEHGIEPCMKCASCKKALNKNHPDIINITHEKPNSIGIDEIRDQLINDVGIKPYESPYKIYIVNDADKLTLQAQNALLKTIEEPPAYAVVMLLADNPDALLPTITSRCVILSLKPVGDRLVKDYLMDRMHIPDYQAEVQASFAQGNVGKAQQMANSAEFTELTENALRILKHSREMEVYELVDAIKIMSAEKQNIYDYLDLFTMWFRDVLLFKATKEVDNLVFKEEINYIKERASVSSYEGLEQIIDAIHMADSRLRANVNFDLVMELLFLTIREN
ncbi:DNA polymerase III subunit delta [Wansuia hejianensis]|uniref:DNA polymerase III subunit delta n=1 Tax=Wansuia hejianensis TaxID=2763667 RepID=A0A7G9GIA9_9FIRM|nr:DNA polymerase III subunit delta' C-terminal domain-containing protein [Wansuia hejianensis]QNM10541.1 DNA polymerase III subunit delta [Wansuia hejianensis]